jgi:hypothetical protein
MLLFGTWTAGQPPQGEAPQRRKATAAAALAQRSVGSR